MKALRIVGALFVFTTASALACDRPGPLYTQTDTFAGTICKGFPDDASREDAFANAPTFAGMQPAETKRPSNGDGGYDLYVAYDKAHHLQYIKRLDIQPLAEKATESMTYALIEEKVQPQHVTVFADLSRVTTSRGMKIGEAVNVARACTGEAIYRFPGAGYRGDGQHGMDLWLDRGRVRGIRFWGGPVQY